jgi:Calx-beta domain/FG-GAP-like repeat
MWFRSLFDSLKPRSARTRARPRQQAVARCGPATGRLSVEPMEDRCLPSFLPAVSYPVGGDPQAVLAADFNNDTVLDLADTNFSSVSVLLGNGDGTFDPAVNSAAGYLPVSLAVGDFDGDGNLDLATGSYYGATVNVLLGNGDGTFQAPRSFRVDHEGPQDVQSVTVGDFNGDGKMDLGVVANFFGYDHGSYSWAHVLLGNGDGNFSGPNTTPLGGSWHYSAVAADLNRDGFDDFVTIEDSWAGAFALVFLGGSSGYLQDYNFYLTGSRSVALGDVDADGDTDLVTEAVSVLLGDGLGNFGAAQFFATGPGSNSVVLGDFTGDGKLDVATTGSNQLSVLSGNGDGTFASAVNSAVGWGSLGAAAGDFDGDGWLDAATANSLGGDVSVLINDRAWAPADAPSVSINNVTVTEGNTGSASATFTLTLSAAYGAPITVHFETANGSAAAGSDYTAASGDVTFAAGQTAQTITVGVLGDRLPEATEAFVVNLTTSDAFIGDSQGVVTILDDEPRISINDVTVTEGNTGSASATFILTLSAAYDTPVTLHYETANGSAAAGSDYTAASGNVTVTAGQTTQTITVAVLGDRLPEPTEDFVVNLTTTDAFLGDGQGVGAILDNEPRISINNVSKKEGNGKGTTLFVFTVSLSVAYDQPVTVGYATANGNAVAGSDYVAQSGTLTFAPGETTKTITIAVYRDRNKEANETFYLDLFGNSSNSLFTKSRGIGTILNDD